MAKTPSTRKKLDEWEERNEAYLATIAQDETLTDAEYLDVLEDLEDRVDGMIGAKREELGEEDDDEGDEDEGEGEDENEDEEDVSE